MQYKCKVTVLDKKLFPDLQQRYLKDPASGACPFYEVGQEFVFTRYREEDDFWRQQCGKHCAEAWDCISRYIYTALQGGAIMRGWTEDERVMIACCNDGTRPVIFKIERLDYLAVYVREGEGRQEEIAAALARVKGVEDVRFRAEYAFFEVYCGKDAPTQEQLRAALPVTIERID